jgi:hypothetical protein
LPSSKHWKMKTRNNRICLGFSLRLLEGFASVVARVESTRERMGESERQVEGLFESLLAEAFS